MSPCRHLVVLIGLVLAGCSSSSGLSEALRVRVGGGVFEGEPARAALVPFEVVNASTRDLYLARCGERLMAAVDRWNGVRWVQHSGDACLTVADMSPLRLAAGASHQSTRAIAEPGMYRLRLGVSAAPSAEYAWDATSAPFTVR